MPSIARQSSRSRLIRAPLGFVLGGTGTWPSPPCRFPWNLVFSAMAEFCPAFLSCQTVCKGGLKAKYRVTLRAVYAGRATARFPCRYQMRGNDRLFAQG